MTEFASQLHEVRATAVEIERLLTDLGGEGDGLGQKARSISHKIPEAVQNDLKQVSYLRNKVMHDGIDLSDAEMDRFKAAGARARQQLMTLNTPQPVPTYSAAPRRASYQASDIADDSKFDDLLFKLVIACCFFYVIGMLNNKQPDLTNPANFPMFIYVGLTIYAHFQITKKWQGVFRIMSMAMPFAFAVWYFNILAPSGT